MSTAKKSLHILFVLDHFFPYIGGGETLFYELTRGLVGEGHHVTVITSRFNKTLEKEEDIDGVRVIRVGTARINFQRRSIIKAINLIRTSKNKHSVGGAIDFVHGATFFSVIPTWIIGKISGLKTVLTVHEVYGKLWFHFVGRMGWVNFLYEWFIMNICRFGHYICVSNYTKNCLRLMYGIQDDKLKTVYNGIDDIFRDSKKTDSEHIKALRKRYELEGKYVGLYFGRLGLAKGFDTVLQSIAGIVRQHSDYIQIFIAPRSQPSTILGMKNSFSVAEIEKYIVKHKLEKHIVWIDSVPRDELRNRIQLADVVILPTRAEGFGFAVSEVCAMGKPLVTTNVASIPEVVYGKVQFVEPGNTQNIIEAIDNSRKGLYQEISPKKFERSTCVKHMESIYLQIIRTPGK